MSTNNPTIFSSDEITILNVLYEAYLNNSQILKVHVPLTDAQVLTSFSVPVLCIAAPGVGYAIRVLNASVAMYASAYSYYATNLQLALYTNVTYPQAKTIATFLDNGGGGTDSHQLFYPVVATNGEDNPITENQALYIKTLVGNPTGGDSPLDVYISYEIIEL